MKRILFGALCMALPAVASAEGRLYGVLDLGLVGGFDQAIAASDHDLRHNWGLGNGRGMRQNYTSRLGVEAFDDLGAGYRIEARIEGTLDALHPFYFDRHAYVGVSGAFGSLRFGRTRDLINGAASRVDPFSNDGLVQDKILVAQLGAIGLFRQPNAVTWTSPSVDGLQASVQFAARQHPGDSNALKLLMTYDRDDWGLHAGVDMAARELQPNGYYRYGPGAHNIVAGALKFIGKARIAAEVLYTDRNMDAAGVDPAFARPTNPWGWIATARMPAGPGELKLALVSSDQVANRYGHWQPIRELGGGYEYFLSRQTFVYLQVGHERKSGGGHWHAGLLTRF